MLIKAGITNIAEGDKWSSYQEYLSKQKILDTEFILGLVGAEEQTAKKHFEEYMNEVNQDVCFHLFIRRK